MDLINNYRLKKYYSTGLACIVLPNSYTSLDIIYYVCRSTRNAYNRVHYYNALGFLKGRKSANYYLKVLQGTNVVNFFTPIIYECL